MKEIYRVEHMTRNSYDEYMGGGYNYTVQYEDVLAENAKEAAAIVKATYRSHVINDGYVKTVAELEAKEKAFREELAKEHAKVERAKAKRKETEARKAAEAGLTVEEYRKEKARKGTIHRLEREITELEKELAEKKALLKNLSAE